MSEHIKSPGRLASEHVHVGSIVEVQFFDDQEEDTETIRIIDRPVRDKSGDHLPTVSLDSPLGRVIINAKAGDILEYDAPGNTVVRIKILSVK